MRKWLKEARKEKQLTQRIVAKKLKMSIQNYNYIENCKRQKELKVSTIMGLSKVFGIKPAEIIQNEVATK